MKKKVEEHTVKSLKETLKHIGPAILTAIIATGLGLSALFTSPVPMITDFGKMLTIGIFISFMVSLFILIPLLFTRDHFFKTNQRERQTRSSVSKFDIILEKLTRIVLSLKWIILIIAILTAMLGIWGDTHTGVETDIEHFMPQDTQALKDIHKLRNVLGTTDQVAVVYSGKNIVNTQGLDWADYMSTAIHEQFPDIVVNTNSITHLLKQANQGTLPRQNKINLTLDSLPNNQLKLFVNKDHTKAVITVGIKHLEAKPLQHFISDLTSYITSHQPKDISTTITGKSVLDVQMISSLTTGRYTMTLLGILLVFLGLLAIYRHPIKAFIPLLPILFIVGWSGGIMFLFHIKYTPLTATLGALIIGIGTEFTILLMERFYEERSKGETSHEAIIIAIKKIGKAILASGISVIGGFSALLISNFVILSNFGMMTLINVCFALISTIIVMPTILILLDRFVKTKQVGDEVTN